MSLDSIRAMAIAADGRGSAASAPSMLTAARTMGSRTERTMTGGTATAAANRKGTKMEPIIRTEGITKRYQLGKENHVDALRGASVEIEAGEMVAIVGPSGSGKSTMMHLIGCLDTPDRGAVYLNGRRVDDLRQRALTKVRSTEIGFIFQGFNLIPTMSALDNVALAAEYAGASKGEAVAKAHSLLATVGLADRANHTPSELSGGQQQRVAIARALVNSPSIVLGDEPTGDLDTSTSDEVMALLRRICETTGTTFVIVTHNPEVAEACDRTIRMRDGKVEDHGRRSTRERAAAALERLRSPSPAAAFAAV